MENFNILINPNLKLNLNLSEIENIIRDNWIKPNKTILYTFIIIFSLIIIIAFLLNILILFTVLISKNLHKPNILLSLNLIIANITSAVICMPFTMNYILSGNWTFNEILCKLIPFIQAVTVFVISSTVTIISIHRYFMITSLKKSKSKLFKPFEFSDLTRKLTKHKLFFNFIIWFVAIILSLPILIYQKLVTVNLNNVIVKRACLEQYPDSIRLIYTILTFIIAFIIPILTLTYFHYKIKIYLNKNLLKFDLNSSNRDKSITNTSTIKTISSKNHQQNFFINLNKRTSDANYYSLMDLNLFNSNDSNSSPTQTRETFSPPFTNNELNRLSIKLNSKKKLHKSLTLSNNFQFNSYLQIYKVNDVDSDIKLTINEKNQSNKSNKLIDNKNSYLSLNYVSKNELNKYEINNSSIITNNNIKNNRLSSSINNNQKARSFRENILKRKQYTKKSSTSSNSKSISLNFIYRSLSDSNLFDTLNQPNLHNSYLHELNNNNNIANSNTSNNSNNNSNNQQQFDQSPSFSSQAINLDYLKLVNFDYNQRHLNDKLINKIRSNNDTNDRIKPRRRSEQIKLASFARFSCFLNRVKRFHYLNRELQRNQKITFILVLGILVFALTWAPLNFLNLYIDFNYSPTSISIQNFYSIVSVCHIISMSSAITNGILYGLLNTNIQKELIKLFKNSIFK